MSMSMSIGRLILMLMSLVHIFCCVWWYIGTVDIDTHVYEYSDLAAIYTDGPAAAPGEEVIHAEEDSGYDVGHRVLLAGGGSTRPIDPNQPPYDESMLGVYEPPGRAFIDSWVFYYQGLGEEDIWSDRYASSPTVFKAYVLFQRSYM